MDAGRLELFLFRKCRHPVTSLNWGCQHVRNRDTWLSIEGKMNQYGTDGEDKHWQRSRVLLGTTLKLNNSIAIASGKYKGLPVEPCSRKQG